ncbi:hypothetical protein GGX14DRAFT_626763 [Mycena pura]|uniref:Uncharacterized protein n=1 Tax=Mycena pura TaxID=153505 RepID=A0AAD7E456_9AGAR|nr:hypothetical protein GGX14DRAFT_626763 [Mycena pura]
MLSLPAAQLISIFISCFLYGIYIVTLGMTGKILLTLPNGQWRTRSEINWIVVVVCFALFVNPTLDIILAMILIMEAFVFYTGPGGPIQVFLHGSAWQTVAKTFCVGMQMVMGDAILIWRCWLIWRSKSRFIAVFPALCCIADFILHVRLLDLLNKETQALVTAAEIEPWAKAFWILGICTNTITTTLIVLRIWIVERQNLELRATTDITVHQHMETTLGRAMRNIIESGMIYTASSILEYTLYTTQGTLVFPASAMVIHSVGIAFNLIIIRSAKQPQEYSLGTSIKFSTNPPIAGIRTTTSVVTVTPMQLSRICTRQPSSGLILHTH